MSSAQNATIKQSETDVADAFVSAIQADLSNTALIDNYAKFITATAERKRLEDSYPKEENP